MSFLDSFFLSVFFIAGDLLSGVAKNKKPRPFWGQGFGDSREFDRILYCG